MVNEILKKYLAKYSYLIDEYKAKYPNLDEASIISDYNITLWQAALVYHPLDSRFEEYLLVLLDRQIKITNNMNN